MTKPIATTCMATSAEMPNRLSAIGIRSSEPPAMPETPQAASEATTHSSRAVGTYTLMPSVCAAASVITVMVMAAPAMLMVAPSGIEIE